MVDSKVKTCARNIRINLFRFCNDISAANIYCPYFGCFYSLLLIFFSFLLLFLFLIGFSFAFNVFFDFSKLLFGGSEMMTRTLIRALIFFLFMFFLIFSDPLLNFFDFLLLIVEVRIIRHTFSALNSALAMIRLMIPFVVRIELSFFFLLSFLSHRGNSKL